jgi:hypothetical protein
LQKLNDYLHDRYIPPLSGPTPNIPSTVSGCNDELKKLESVLAQVHEEMHAGLTSTRREEQMWDAQRIVTQLKVIFFIPYWCNILKVSNLNLQRKLRLLQKPSEPRVSDDEKMDLSLRHDEATTAAPSLPPTIAEKLPEVHFFPVTSFLMPFYLSNKSA